MLILSAMYTTIPLSRRALLKASTGTLLATALWPGALRAADVQRKNLRFAVINDLHIYDDQCASYFEPLVKQINTEDIDLLLIAGDLTNDSHIEQFDLFKTLFGKIKVPFRVVPGNHDLCQGHKAWDDAFKDASNYVFDLADWQFIGLDTCDGTNYQKITILNGTLDYAKTALDKIDPKKPLVLFTHFPLGENVLYRPTNADDVLDLFKKHNLRAAFSGHFHGFTEHTCRDAVLTTNRCCSRHVSNHDGTKEQGYFILACDDGKLTRTFVEYKLKPA